MSVGGVGATTGLRVGLGVEGVDKSLPKKVPVHTLQFDRLVLHHASGQLTPLSHEQPLHFELLTVVVTSVLVVVVLVLLVVVSGSTGGGVGYTLK